MSDLKLEFTEPEWYKGMTDEEIRDVELLQYQIVNQIIIAERDGHLGKIFEHEDSQDKIEATIHITKKDDLERIEKFIDAERFDEAKKAIEALVENVFGK